LAKEESFVNQSEKFDPRLKRIEWRAKISSIIFRRTWI